MKIVNQCLTTMNTTPLLASSLLPRPSFLSAEAWGVVGLNEYTSMHAMPLLSQACFPKLPSGSSRKT